MKKSIVLLISLFFITAITALVIKNLDDTQNYVELQNSKINKVQILSLSKNVQEQVSEIISKNSEHIDEIISSQLVDYFPLKIEDIDLKFKIAVYDKIDINKLSSNDEAQRNEVVTFLNDNNVFNTDNLRYLLKDNKINSNKQLDDIIKTFIKETYDNKILEIRDLIGFKSLDSNLYEIFIKVNYFKDFLDAYYILNKQGGVEYFELSFK